MKVGKLIDVSTHFRFVNHDVYSIIRLSII